MYSCKFEYIELCVDFPTKSIRNHKRYLVTLQKKKKKKKEKEKKNNISRLVYTHR